MWEEHAQGKIAFNTRTCKRNNFLVVLITNDHCIIRVYKFYASAYGIPCHNVIFKIGNRKRFV